MITKIITHNRPHADELVALMLLKKFPQGEEKFPGVTTAEVSFLTTGELPNGQTAKDFPDTIFLGCGGGDFDEHATSQKERVEGECCATLVAKYLGIDKDPALQRILFFVKQEDLEGSKSKSAISVMIKSLHGCYKNKPKEIYDWCEMAYFAEYLNDKDNKIESEKWETSTYQSSYRVLRSQKNPKFLWWKKFIDEAIIYQDVEYKKALKEFRSNAKIENIKLQNGESCILSVIHSDNEEINKVARSEGSDVVVIINSKGNVGIYTAHKKRIDLTNAFVLLRLAEQKYSEGIKISDINILSQEGLIKGIPWYLMHTKNTGFNGSFTTSDIPPTKIPHEKLIELIKQGLTRDLSS